MRALSLLLVLTTFPACGGDIGALFGAFPPEAFQPESPGGGGEIPGGPDGPGGGFRASEVGFLEAAQGVTGDVRNIALAQVGAQSIAFLSAGANGVHMVDITQPELINSRDFLTTVRDSVLTAPATISGGRVDAIAVVDNTYLVCVAVGTGATDAVTVFHIPTLIMAATSPVADLSSAFVAKIGGPDIAVPGLAGQGGGVSGRAGVFVVATGGTDLGIGAIVPGTPGTWASTAAFVSAAAPKVDNFIDVLFTLNGVFASVKSDEVFGIIAMTITGAAPPTVTPVTPAAIDVEDTEDGGDFDLLAMDDITGPGNFPMDLALDTVTLAVTGDNQVRLFNITNPSLTTPPSEVLGTGEETIAVTGSAGFFALGIGNGIRVYSQLTGQPVLTAGVTLDAINMRIRGVAMTSSAAGRFVLACSGTRGLRVIQWSDIP